MTLSLSTGSAVRACDSDDSGTGSVGSRLFVKQPSLISATAVCAEPAGDALWNPVAVPPDSWHAGCARPLPGLRPGLLSPPSAAAEAARFGAMAGLRAAAAELADQLLLLPAGAEASSGGVGRLGLPAGARDAWLAGRRSLELTGPPDPDGRQWDDPLLPWRFVDQVDSWRLSSCCGGVLHWRFFNQPCYTRPQLESTPQLLRRPIRSTPRGSWPISASLAGAAAGEEAAAAGAARRQPWPKR